VFTGLFVCCVSRGQESVKHFTVTANNNGYMFGLAKFPNMTEFLNHFQSRPLLGGESGNLHIFVGIFLLSLGHCL